MTWRELNDQLGKTKDGKLHPRRHVQYKWTASLRAIAMELRRNAATRFARGRARKSPWCAVNHRRNDWASRSPSEGSSKK